MVVAMMVGAGVLAPSPARAVDDPPKVKNPDKVVGGKDRKVKPRMPDKAGTTRVPPVNWPAPAKAQVDIPAKATAKAVAVPRSPIALSAPKSTTDVADKVQVQVLDRRAAQRAGLDGAAFLLTRTDTKDTGKVAATVDYSGFAHAYGGDYASRLRLAAYPACVLTTPDKDDCGTPVPVTQSRNDGEKQALSGEVAVGGDQRSAEGGPVVLAATAGDSSDKGDYKATDLKASATWGVGENTGDFTWSYPLRNPPVPGGLEPDLKVGYSSQSVDGRTANTNNQPSWVGEGFELSPGFIERRYKPCADDGAPKNNGIDPGDQCWEYDNATVTWNGKAGELIKASDGTWRMTGDDGTKFEKLKDSGRGNGDNSGEYWRVTTADGTQFYFGFNRLPGWSSGKPETGSTWTVPVFGNDSGEPCHDDTYASSWCQQAYRWNLDYALDRDGNALAYYYNQETNYYGRNVTTSADTKYVRGGYLTRIEYGLRSDAMFAAEPARVTFGTSERCIPTDSFDCDPSKIKDKPDKWPDVPWDMNCTSGDECALKGKIAPTFWSRKRLSTVTTQVIKSDGSGYQSVDSWSLDHQWGQADIDQALLIKSIQHTGHPGTGSVTLPKVTFNHLQLMNRLDKSGDDIPAFIKYRVGAVFDESGGQVDINYSGEDCKLSDLPSPASNSKRCYPVYWTPEGRDNPIRDWFHKYVVTETIASDRTGDSPDMITRYEYLGGAAWHYDDDDGLTKKKHKTWSQWRGYGKVQIRTGGFDDGMLTLSEKLFLRGMHGDRASADGGTKDVSVSDGEGGTHTDHEAWAGHLLKETDYTEPGGGVAEKTVNTPWKHQTAERDRTWGTTTANLTGTRKEHTFSAVPGGWRETHTFTDFETTAGLPTQVDDRGDISTSADNRCTRTSYAANTGAWMLDYPSREEAVSVRCDQTPERSTDVISDERSFYDGKGYGEAPTRGNVTKTERIASHDGQTARYVTKETAAFDGYGRQTAKADAHGQLTRTGYTDTRGLTTKKVTTGPPVTSGDDSSAHVETEEIDPAWGLPASKTNPGGKTTTLTYDAMGRLAKVWLPNQPTSNPPSMEFSYRIADGKIAAVGTRKVTDRGELGKPTYTLYDGMLRKRQIQEPGPDGGRLISDTLYDSRGNATTKYETYYNRDSGPVPTLFGAFVGDIETQIDYTHDGLNRVTVEKLMVGNNTPTEKWRTTTSYSGDRETVTPPDGGTPTTTIRDARDQTTEIRHYTGDTPTGEFEATTYTYTPAGKLATVTDPAGNGWRYSYDLHGRKIKEEDPDQGTTTYTYNLLDQQVTSTDARGRTLWNRYDPLGRKIAVRDSGATGPLRTSWTYDTLRKGVLTSSTRHIGANQYVNRVTMLDNLDQPRQFKIDIPQSEGELAGTYNFAITYGRSGHVLSRSAPAVGGLPADGVVTNYDDEDLGRPVQLMGRDNTTLVGTTHWSETGKLLQLQLGAGKRAWITNEWERGTQRLTRNHVQRENQPKLDRDARYGYDDTGNITKIADYSATGIDTQCFSYGFRRRLQEAWSQGTKDDCASTPSKDLVGGPAPYWVSYDYDTSGNRTKETRHGLGQQSETVRDYAYPAAGAPQPHTLSKVTETGPDGSRLDQYSYDETGNTTKRNLAGDEQNLTWDAEGRLQKVTDKNGKETSFVYDADGNRLLRKEPGATTLYLPHGTEAKLTHANQAVTGTRYYTFADQTVAMRTEQSLYHLAGDHHGSGSLQIHATTQAVSQRRIEPFGAPRGDDARDWAGDKGFVGGTEDATGLVHLGAREYDPQTGRFISVDPIMDLTDPQQMHGYAYANHNPITDADPTGLCSMTCLENNIGGQYIQDGKVKRYPKSYQKRVGIGKYWRRGRPSYAHYRFRYQVKRRPAPPPCDLSCKIQRALNNLSAGATAATIDTVYSTACTVTAGSCSSYETAAELGLLPSVDDVIQGYADMAGADQDDGWFQGGYWGAIVGSVFIPGGGAAAGAARGLGALRGLGRSRALVKCNSFAPGTLVLLADGTTKPIEDVTLGEKVLATDPETGKTKAKTVVATIKGDGTKQLVRISVDSDGAPNLGGLATTNSFVTATAGHPFWVDDLKRWVPAAELEPGMWLRTSAGTFVQTSAVKAWTAKQPVHNLTIDDIHTYHVHVGTTDVLVHNCPKYTGRHRKSNSESLGKGPYAGKHRKDLNAEKPSMGPREADAYAAKHGLNKGETGGQPDRFPDESRTRYVLRRLGEIDWGELLKPHGG